jgi:hypothetical protein
VGESETAFNGRDVGFTFNINGNSETAEGFEAERDWARSYWSALAPHHTSVYVNFLMEEGEERIRQAYGAEKYERLKALKRTYDRTNFFRLNQNIPQLSCAPPRAASERLANAAADARIGRRAGVSANARSAPPSREKCLRRLTNHPASRMSLLFTSSDFEGPYPRLRVIKGSVLYMDLRVLNPEVVTSGL